MKLYENQRTIKSNTSIEGVGLHTGRKCKATFVPAPENTGIQFIRTDVPGKPSIPATVDYVAEVIRGTTIGKGDTRIYTIEHILSALSGLGIDNMIIELDDNEPPVMDGSAKHFVETIEKAGIKDYGSARNFFEVREPIEYTASQSLIKIEPSNKFEIDCTINYDHPILKDQRFEFSEEIDYQTQIAPAKTYCFDYEIEGLKKRGLAKGGTLDNAIVIGPTGIYNPGSFLQFKNEFVRHKILDLMGDLVLLGSPIKGKITALRSGHGHNVKFLQKLLQAKSATPSSASLS